jgi:6-aminohexanoate-oligomer endohydrolase
VEEIDMRIGWAVFLALALSSGGVGTGIVPQARIPEGGPVLEFEFPGLRIGVAEYDEGPTGGTAFLFDKSVLTSVDVRGGAPGTMNTDALRLAYDQPFVRAITLAGGSSYGLGFAAGVAEAIKERTPDPGHWDNIAVVPGAIIFDLGGRRFSSVTPDAALGRAAVAAARPGRFPLGPHGGGRFAMQGSFFGPSAHSGQGAAFRQVGPTKIAVFTVVNALGTIVDRHGRVVRCRDQEVRGGECGTIADRLARLTSKEHKAASLISAPTTKGGLTENTTITLVVVNQKLPVWALQRLATEVHSSLARAIQPFSTESDGDTLFAVTTAAVENPSLSPLDLSVIASEVAWDAVLATVPPLDARGSETPVAVTAEALERYVGDYDLSPDARVRVTRAGTALRIQALTDGGMYVPKGAPVTLTPVGESRFLLDTPRRDLLRFDVDAGGRVTGLTIDPGTWPIPARRVEGGRTP